MGALPEGPRGQDAPGGEGAGRVRGARADERFPTNKRDPWFLAHQPEYNFDITAGRWVSKAQEKAERLQGKGKKKAAEAQQKAAAEELVPLMHDIACNKQGVGASVGAMAGIQYFQILPDTPCAAGA